MSQRLVSYQSFRTAVGSGEHCSPATTRPTVTSKASREFDRRPIATLAKQDDLKMSGLGKHRWGAQRL